MNEMQKMQYINIKQFKIVLYLLGIISFITMIVMEYDREFKITILLPICYILCLFFFVKPGMGEGIGKVAVVVMYAFRMCILPVLCAYGNFWLEPARNTYIQYYGAAILLTCFECILVFGSLCYFYKYYKNKITKKYLFHDKNIIIKIMVAILLLIAGCLFFLHPNFLLYFRFLTTEENDKLIDETVTYLQSYGTSYYLLVLVDIIVRPLFAFLLTDYFLKRNKKFCVIIVGLVNVLFITDRRILSFLVGGCCMIQLLLYLKQGISKKVLYGLVGVLAIVTICYCFYGTTEPYLISRKFQRYFSGPILTAIGITVNQIYRQNPIGFFKLLFNNSYILTGLFHRLEVPAYSSQLTGSYSIWTPMMIGSIQYFSIFAPIIIVIIVRFIVKCDYISENSKSGVYKLMMNYLSISVAIYMIMYTVDLIFYTILFFGGLYNALIWLDKKVVLKN